MTKSSTRQSKSFAGLSAMRKPERITVTIPFLIYQGLLDRSEQEGRSLSNLAAYLLERSLFED